MTENLLQPLALFGAFWTALALYSRSGRSGRPAPEPFRFVAALALGAVFGHMGWALLHGSAVAAHPEGFLDPTRGFCVLFVPLGPLLLAPRPAAFASLPLAFAVARLGCLAAGCCHGENGEPTPLYEIGGLVILHGVVGRLSVRWVTAVVLAGLGLIRLAVEPMRSIPPLGAPVIPIEAIAALWVGLGIAMAVRSAGDLGKSARPGECRSP